MHVIVCLSIVCMSLVNLSIIYVCSDTLMFLYMVLVSCGLFSITTL